jgi:hypothetical protein
MNFNTWTSEIESRLSTLWIEGKDSSHVIADTINREFRTTFSRNAIIGKVARMGLPMRARGPKAKVRTNYKRQPPPPKPEFIKIKRKPVPKAERVAMPPDPASVRPFLALDPHKCLYVVGEGPIGALRCGAIREERHGKLAPYCAFHCNMCYK